MQFSQQSNPIKKVPLPTVRNRLTAGGAFLAVAGMFFLLWSAGRGWLDLSSILGVCGFKQKYQLPCPGCYIIIAAIAFAQGRIIDAFRIQPAGAILCCGLAAVGVFALLVAIFAVDFPFLHRPANTRKLLVCLVISTIIVIVSGWIITLARELATSN